ncbi:arsenate reductase ArsC [candidate division WOR-3 bacterium]|uniref:Arsenate reductase ArsC n=1 Tax=candidate division WOR-3 bacterium TaxID=2052148 RepID=A0A9D5KA61_UNCW3|nr:arsenate reductase ArsC [candidate division WOR-3 bacterium]MBD3365221.1 arsenate reductase ArsC [candidate division WOR-3 bacterium]
MDKKKVIFLCRGNSARSQMAEALLRKHSGDKFEVHSAGLEPTEIHPFTRKVIKEAGISLEGQRAKSLKEYLGRERFHYVIFVCGKVKKDCPATFPGVGESLFWDVEDPVDFEGTDKEKLAKFREVRDDVERRIKEWIAGLHL